MAKSVVESVMHEYTDHALYYFPHYLTSTCETIATWATAMATNS
eukprot:COSAG01_NODE_2090_length_8453_cov_554.144721_6_plen_44_part_00